MTFKTLKGNIGPNLAHLASNINNAWRQTWKKNYVWADLRCEKSPILLEVLTLVSNF